MLPYFFIYRAYFILQGDFCFVSWITVLLRYSFWTSTTSVLSHLLNSSACLVYIIMEKAIIKLQNDNGISRLVMRLYDLSKNIVWIITV